jgi:hypothetical protein
MQRRIDVLIILEEEREKNKDKFHEHQLIIKHWFDKHLVDKKYFQIGDLVLKLEKTHKDKGKHTKFVEYIFIDVKNVKDGVDCRSETEE